MKWLLFQYELPSSPSKCRVYVWRKLKKFGACPILDGLYVLPSSKRSLERFNWLCAEVQEMQGNTMLWEASSLLPQQEELLRNRFDELVQGRYLALKQELAECKHDSIDIKTLELWSREWADIRWHDWFEHPLGEETLEMLNRIRKPLQDEEDK
jgi:hypothetical protein